MYIYMWEGCCWWGLCFQNARKSLKGKDKRGYDNLTIRLPDGPHVRLSARPPACPSARSSVLI